MYINITQPLLNTILIGSSIVVTLKEIEFICAILITTQMPVTGIEPATC